MLQSLYQTLQDYILAKLNEKCYVNYLGLSKGRNLFA